MKSVNVCNACLKQANFYYYFFIYLFYLFVKQRLVAIHFMYGRNDGRLSQDQVSIAIIRYQIRISMLLALFNAHACIYHL